MVLCDGRVSPVTQPYLVVGWQNDKLVLILKDSENKDDGGEALVFSDFEPTIPLDSTSGFPLLLIGDYEGKGLKIKDGSAN